MIYSVILLLSTGLCYSLGNVEEPFNNAFAASAREALPNAGYYPAGVPGFPGGAPSTSHTGAVPSGAIPSGAIPTGAVPSGAVPAGAVPPEAIPSGAHPAGIHPVLVSFNGGQFTSVPGPYGEHVRPIALPNYVGNLPPNAVMVGEILVPVNSQYGLSPYYNQLGGNIHYPQMISGQSGFPQFISPYSANICQRSSVEGDETLQDEYIPNLVDPQGQAIGMNNFEESSSEPKFSLSPEMLSSNENEYTGRSSLNEEPAQATYDSYLGKPVHIFHPPIPVHKPYRPPNHNFNHGVNNAFHTYGYSKPLPHGGYIYTRIFTNNHHNNLHR